MEVLTIILIILASPALFFLGALLLCIPFKIFDIIIDLITDYQIQKEEKQSFDWTKGTKDETPPEPEYGEKLTDENGNKLVIGSPVTIGSTKYRVKTIGKKVVEIEEE